ncbi:MAG: glycoside hydrolase family 15 protein [Bdellovibrionales bacterium]|nr:glycoside hydrolase family 15 protein [Bdellovibrionales bacterium]
MTESGRHTYKLGLIGNCSYMAYIDETSNVSWLCWPQFDSPFVFGGLLDPAKGGHFWVRPAGDNYKTKQYYLSNTTILVTEFESSDGAFRVIDFAPRFYQYERYFKPTMLFRKLEPLSGHPKIKVSCRPVGEYGQKLALTNIGSNHIAYSGLARNIRLTSDIPLSFIEEEKPFVLNTRKYLTLSWGIPLEAPLESTTEEFLHKTRTYWEHWVLGCSVGVFNQKQVIRSALTLKLHQFDDTGAIIAAGTTSLPEAPHSGRTWDYRYCWLRDAYYALSALNNLGQFEELKQFSNFMLNIAASDHGRYNPVYTIQGNSDLEERQLDLWGYRGNQPVRIGNQAATHVQNDLYGQILVSLLPVYVDARFADRERYISKQLINRLLSGIEKTIDEPDAGLWEYRNTVQKHCYTFLFHWAGACAGQNIARVLQDGDLFQRASQLRETAASQIEACYDEKRGVYTEAIGQLNLDSSLLQLITMGYLDPSSEKARRHLAILERELKTKDGLFYRYKHADDFGVPQVTFMFCAFWYVESLCCVGRTTEALEVFQNLLGYSNHLGLLSEDIDPATGSQWGNFPQAYSHVGLINAASRLSRKTELPVFLVDEKFRSHEEALDHS